MSQLAAHLTPTTLESLREQLRHRRQELGEQLAARLAESEAARDSGVTAEVSDTKDLSFLAALAEVRVAGAARDVQELRDIDAALARMHGGVFGICSDCDDAIPEARLKAYPTAKRCRPCQEVKEQEAARR